MLIENIKGIQSFLHVHLLRHCHFFLTNRAERTWAATRDPYRFSFLTFCQFFERSNVNFSLNIKKSIFLNIYMRIIYNNIYKGGNAATTAQTFSPFTFPSSLIRFWLKNDYLKTLFQFIKTAKKNSERFN